jgi:AcrR family transcriptional regulator
MIETLDLGLSALDMPGEAHERADAAANRRLILQTAARLFEERGVAEVTMADIALEAGVGKGTLYRRFDNKAELALALMDSQTRDFQNSVLEQLRLFGETGHSYVSRLEYFLDALVHFTDQHLSLLCVVQSEELVEDREHSRPYHWQYQTVAGLLQRCIAAGEITAAIDVPYTADALLAPLQADIYRYQRDMRGFSLERISSGLRAIVRAL